jgi:hypothetical protein
LEKNQTRTEKIIIVRDYCEQQYALALEERDPVTTMIALWRVDGILNAMDAIHLPEVRALIDKSDQLVAFAELCHEVAPSEEE